VYPRLLSPSESIEELFGFYVVDKSIIIGSCCPLSKIQHKCADFSEEQPRLARTVMPMHDMLRWFASTQIRNVACLGGNLVTASPISDMNPMLASMNAKLVLTSVDDSGGALSRRSVPVSDFFLKYRTVDLNPTEIVERVEVPVLDEVFEYLKPFKQARRREDDISIVTSGMRIKVKVANGQFVIDDIALAFGGMAPTTVLALKTASIMIGAEFCASTFNAAQESLLTELALPEGVPGGQAAFRMTLASSFLHKFFLSVVEELKQDLSKIKMNPSLYAGLTDKMPEVPIVDAREATGTVNFLSEKKPIYAGVQRYPAPTVAKGLEEKVLPSVTEAKSAEAAVLGKPSAHVSGPLHCTGEALYTDDIPLPPGTLQAALVLSDRCGGVLEAIDTSAALAIPGVFGVYTYVDIVKLGGSNLLGPILQDEVVFLPEGEIVRTVGQVLGIVVAESLESAELGARVVKVLYKESTEKIIVTIEDAIEVGSFYESFRHSMERGDGPILDGLQVQEDTIGEVKVGDIVKVSGSFRSGAQEHFYLETNSTLVVPSESDTNLTVYASTQAPTKTHMFCASSTGTPASKVVVRVKRMGGGFGGKETRSVFASCAAAVAAKSSCRPVRLTLARNVDMSESTAQAEIAVGHHHPQFVCFSHSNFYSEITGTRHAFVSEYCASAVITPEGARLVAMDVKLYANAGCGFDLSGPVVDRALFHVDGCYYFPNFRAMGVPCKTVQPPHTAFRGFGGPQGMVVGK
jgi:xanthine dehydrogenase/oxidase